MSENTPVAINHPTPPFLPGHSEMRTLIREFNWDNHPLGRPAAWPESFATALSIVLNNRFPMFLFWGPDAYCFYNDAYRPSLGEEGRGKHPGSLGKPGKEVWPEIWEIIGPQITQVMNGGEATWHEDQLVPIYRNGAIEHVFWTYCYSAVTERSGNIAGVLVTCIETTQKVAAELSLKAEAKRVRESEQLFRSLAENLPDIISRHDRSLAYTYANSRITAYTGKKPEELIGRPFSETGLPVAIQHIIEHHLKLAFDNAEPQAVEYQTAEGRYFHARMMPERNDQQQVESVLIISNDVTEWKKTEQAFQDKKERLQAALDASLTGTFRWDIQTNELTWDANLDRLFGLAPGESVQSLESFIERVYADDRPAVMEECLKCAAYGSDFSMEFRVVWPDGSLHWIDDKGKTYKSPEGKPLYMTGACVDVTDAAETRKKIEDSERRFRYTFENAAVGVALLGISGNWILINNKLSEILGYSNDELNALTFQEITYPEDLTADLAHVDDLLEGRSTTYSMEKRYIRKDGSLLWANLTVSLLRDDAKKPLYFISIIQDISKRKKTEEALFESKNQLTQLSDFMPQIVWATDATGNHHFFNQRWYDFTGLTFDETKAEGWIKLLHPADVDRTVAIWNESLKTGKLYEIEYRMRRYDGEYRWLLARAMPFRNMHGKIIQWLGTCTDIQYQKTTEERLEVLVAERTRELKRSNEDLQQFAHVASHDLKEPLRKVRVFADQVNSFIAKGQYETAVPYLARIDRAIARMYEMIDGVLEYSYVDGTPIVIEPVDLNTVVALIENDLQFLFEKKKGKLTYQSLPTILGVNILIQRVFNNLLYNSLKFAHPDRDPVINISADLVIDSSVGDKKLAGKYYKIIVTDNGIGFSDEQAEYIFSTFTRLHSKDKYEGTGLGLALCRKIVERHGGYIYANGTEEQGATFTLFLPAVENTQGQG